MKKFILSTLTSLALFICLSSAHASVLNTATTSTASEAELYGVFHDRPTNFVFVKLPQGWALAGTDEFKGLTLPLASSSSSCLAAGSSWAKQRPDPGRVLRPDATAGGVFLAKGVADELTGRTRDVERPCHASPYLTSPNSIARMCASRSW